MLIAASDHAVEAVEQLTEAAVVSFSVEGSKMIGAFALHPDEHERRQRAGVGAITSKALLHGLWLLPSGGFVASGTLPDVKVARLRMAPHCAVETYCGFWRTYAPPGVLRTIVFSGSNVARSVQRAVRFTPIFQRIVLAKESNVPIPWSVECMAREWGVGIIALQDNGGPQIVVPASSPVIGVPSVYRWWVAELAYERFLYENDQLVS